MHHKAVKNPSGIITEMDMGEAEGEGDSAEVQASEPGPSETAAEGLDFMHTHVMV